MIRDLIRTGELDRMAQRLREQGAFMAQDGLVSWNPRIAFHRVRWSLFPGAIGAGLQWWASVSSRPGG